MENKCKMCGQCCRKIHIDAKVCWDLKDRKLDGEDAKFISENWEYLGSSEDVGGFTVKDFYGHDVYFGIYQCKLVSEDNKCTIHKDKPRICSGYPWYEKGKGECPPPWPYIGCGYEKDSHDVQLLKVLRLIRNKKEDADGKREVQPIRQIRRKEENTM